MMKKIFFTCAFFMMLLNLSLGQLTAPGGTVNNSFSPTNVGINVPNPTSTLELQGDDVLFEGNNFRTGGANTINNVSFSGALGMGNQLDDSNFSGALGMDNHVLFSNSCFALGENNIFGTVSQNNEGSVILGEANTITDGHGSVSIGGHNEQTGFYTYTLGSRLTVNSPLGSVPMNSIAMGTNLINSTPNSLMVGFSTGASSPPTTVPTLFVGKSGGADRVGVNILNPQTDLHVAGIIRSDSLAGVGNRAVCADAQGNLVVGVCGSGGGGSDNLGNHIATQELNMSCESIIEIGKLEFCNSMFFGQATIPGAPIPNELILDGGALGIGVSPSSVGTWTSGTGNPATLAVAGDIWANGAWYFSDKRFKKNIDNLSSALDKVKQMNGYSYEYKQEEFPEHKFASGRTIGFLAQELKEVSPELVQKTKTGYYSVNYTGVIPILTEAIKEQQGIIEIQTQETERLNTKINNFETEIADLKDAIKSLCNNGCGNLEILNNSNSTNILVYSEEIKLEQNAPNPFNSVTTIEYYLPQEVTNAALLVYDLQGKQLKKYEITQTGKGVVEIASGDLSGGIYLYSLLVDGKPSHTLKMILTE